MNKELVLVGDRVLVMPDSGKDKTDAGLYLPEGVREKEKIQAGTVVKVGPGYPVPDPSSMEIEPWQTPKFDNKYFPLQAKEGDYCIFLRNAGVEIKFERKKYIVVPHPAILALVRNRPHTHPDDALL